jgi:O-antigen/teichoic acid export membrane protein
MKPSISQLFVRGEASFGLWNGAAKGVAIINSFIALSWLTFYQFGLYQLLLASISLVGILLIDGLNSVVFNDVIRFAHEGDAAKSKMLFTEFSLFKVVTGFLLGIFVFGVGMWVGKNYDHDIGILIQILAPSIFLDSLLTIIDVFLRAELKFGLIAVQSFIREASKLILLIGFLVTTSVTVRSIVIAHTASLGILVGLLMITSFTEIRRKLISRREGSGTLMRLIMSYGKWAILRSGVKEFSNKINPWLVKIFISTEAVSIFSVATSLVDLINSFFPGNVISSLIPRELTDEKRFRRIFVYGLKYFLFAGILLAAAGVLGLSGVVLLGLPKYQIALPYFAALSITTVMYAVSKFTGAVLTAKRDQRFLFGRMTLTVVIVLVLSPFLYPLWGVWGAVFIAILNSAVATGLFLWRAIKLQPTMHISLKEFFHFDSRDRDFLKNLMREIRALFRSPHQASKL